MLSFFVSSPTNPHEISGLASCRMLPLDNYSTASSIQLFNNVSLSLYRPASVDLAVHRIAVPRLQYKML